jgi:transaldolase
MNENPLVALTDLGQSIWIDELARGQITSGQVHHRIEHDGLRGLTSNPTIFEKSITNDPSYDEPIRALARRGKTAAEICDALTIEDIQLAADELRPLFDRVDPRDGFVSLEVSPHLAYDTRATIDEARRLWRAVERPNVMIKVPGTKDGIPAMETLVAEGININVTLLFGLGRHREVAEAYMAALRSRVGRGLSPRVASVASFFLSRIDVMVDAELDTRERNGDVSPQLAARVRGQVAIASAKLAFQQFKELFGAERFGAFQEQGARPQRVLWASTSTKNPAYSDVYYIEALIGEGTIDTMPVATFEAYRDHGRPELRLERDLERASSTLRDLARAGIDLDAVTERLEHEGVRKFAVSYDGLLARIEQQREQLGVDARACMSR